MKKLFCIFLSFLLCALCLSCARTDAQPTNAQYLFNSSTDTEVTVNDRYICISGEQPKLIDRTTGKEYKLPLSPFENAFVHEALAAADGIYILSGQESLTLTFYDRQFQEHVLLKQESAFSDGDVFSLPSFHRTSNMERVEDDGIRFFFTDGNALYLCTGNSIVSHQLTTGKERTLLTADLLQGVSYANGKIYYTDQSYQLFAYDLETAETAALEHVAALDFIVTGEAVIYRNLEDKSKLYFYSETDGQLRKLTDAAVRYYRVVPQENALYYADKNNQLYCVGLETFKTTHLPISLKGEAFLKLPNEQKIVAVSYPNGVLQAEMQSY